MKTWILGIAALGVAMTATGCKKKTPAATGDTTPPAETKITEVSNEDVRTGLQDPKDTMVTLGSIYFELDAATLSEESKATLRANAQALLGNAAVTVRVEGHADERGSTQYNLSLGERRANAVKTYL